MMTVNLTWMSENMKVNCLWVMFQNSNTVGYVSLNQWTSNGLDGKMFAHFPKVLCVLDCVNYDKNRI